MAILGLHHIHIRVSDLEGTRAFAKDFGCHEVQVAPDGKVYLRGAGAEAYMLVLESAATSSLAGLAFAVDDRADLERAIATNGASSVRSLSGPGGGEAVTMMDPEGTAVHLVHGVERRTPTPLRPPAILNQGADKERRGAPQFQPPLEPAQLLRLGHVGLFVRNFKACDAWYRKALGLIPSDVMYAGSPQNTVVGFYRIDRGSQWVDHHTVALFGLGKSDLHHISLKYRTRTRNSLRTAGWMARATIPSGALAAIQKAAMYLTSGASPADTGSKPIRTPTCVPRRLRPESSISPPWIWICGAIARTNPISNNERVTL